MRRWNCLMMKKKSKTNADLLIIKRIFLCLVLSVAFLIGITLASTGHATEGATKGATEKLYIAGAPDGYPIEYYDSVTKSYKGLLPNSLDEISESVNVDIEYIDPSDEDNRIDMAKKIQIDFICTYGLDDKEVRVAGLTLGEELFSFMKNGEEVAIRLAYTKSMPVSLIEKLEKQLSKYWLDEADSLLIEFASSEHQAITQSKTHLIIMLIVLASIVLVILLILIILSKRNGKIKSILMIDEITGHDSYQKWEMDYANVVVPENREHYYLMFLQTNVDKVMSLYSYEVIQEILTEISNSIIPLVDIEKEGFSRYNQSDFVFYLRYNKLEDVEKRVKKIMNTVSEDVLSLDHNFSSQMHSGIYCLKVSDSDIKESIYYTEIAKENASINSSDFVIYNKDVERQTLSKYSLGNEAVHGLFNDEFQLYLQPIFNMDTNKIYGAETLVRWNHPTRGLLYPNDFMDIMKKQNLIGKMDMEIYRQGCKLLSQVNQKDSSDLNFLFNFSADSISQDGFVSDIKGIANQYNIDHKNILIQLNQVIDSSQDEELIDIVSKLRTLGFNICLAELELDREFYNYLSSGINIVKIRHDLVKHVEEESGQKIIKSIVNMCNDLELLVLCVGVENGEQANALQKLNCHLASGYHFCYPLDKEQFANLLS